MPDLIRRFLDALRRSDYQAVIQWLAQMDDRQLVACLHLLGPAHLRDIRLLLDAGQAAGAAPRIRSVIAMLQNLGLPWPVGTGTALALEMNRLLSEAGLRPEFHFTTDPTDLLPNPNPGAPRLAAGDFATAASGLGVETAAVRAVADVESGGRTGFDSLGRPKILFEAHYFHRLTRGRFWVTHPHLSQPTQKRGKPFYKWDQWGRMYEAMLLDPHAAWSSASWGMFQVMGENHNGSATVEEFVPRMFESEARQLEAFLAFCKDNGLVKHLKAKDWASFAAGYNGPGYADNAYDTKMAAAYLKYGGK